MPTESASTLTKVLLTAKIEIDHKGSGGGQTRNTNRNLDQLVRCQSRLCPNRCGNPKRGGGVRCGEYRSSTVLGYSKNYFGLNDTWNTAIDGAVALSIGAFTTGWRLTNRRELQNIINEAGAATRVLNYAPFSISIDYNFWSSTTAQYDTTRAYILGSNSTGWVYALPKASAACSYIACRTFTVTGTILT